MAERVVIVVEPGDELRAVVRAAQQLAPDARALHVVGLLSGADDSHRDVRTRAIEALEAALSHWPIAPGAVRTVTTSFELRVDADQLEGALVVIGPWRSRAPRERARALVELSSRARLVASVGRGAVAPATAFQPARTVGVVFGDLAALDGLAAMVRALPAVSAVIGLGLGVEESRRDELDAGLRALLPGVATHLELLAGGPLNAGEVLEAAAARHAAELVIIPREGPEVVVAATGLLAARALDDAGRPFVIVRVEPARGQRLVVSDSLRISGAPPRVTLELLGTLGRVPLTATSDAGASVAGERATQGAAAATERGTEAAQGTPNDTAAGTMSGWVELAGRPGVRLPIDEGVIELPGEVVGAPERLSPFAVTLALPHASLVAAAHVIGGDRPLVLVDAQLGAEHFGDLERLAPDAELVFVRLRADEALADVRERLLATLPWGGPALLIDARAWLDDGGASDVPRAVDPLRLVRLGVRLRALGARVAAVIISAEVSLSAPELRVFTPASLARFVPGSLSEAPRHAEPLELLTGARPIAGNAVTLEFDNAVARRSVLEAAATARERLHLQSYIFEDDAIVRSVCDALAAAVQRGVAVRVLADALYSLHGAYGSTNVVLERLAASGVEVRAWQPLSGVPSLESLKARNHRKVVVVDGERAWLSGRNLGASYYQGFDEVQLTPQSAYADVPWVDCSARVTGPIVADFERAFLADWVRAGGAGFEVTVPPPAGALQCRLVQHEGLADTHTLELQRLLIERARERLVLVNTFPLVFDLQRALIAAVRRGVRVQVLFGNVRPRWGDGQPFGGAAYRELGDELVRARLEPVLSAGGEGYEVCLPARPGWSPELGHLWPHVHAKLLVSDEAQVAVGSANVDVTSAYWESEALLLVEDAGFARETLAQLEPLIATARRVDLSGPDWAPLHVRREWLGRYWPTILG